MGRGEPIFRRCGKCSRRKASDGACGSCGHKGHTWTFVVDVAPPGAPRRQVMRSGFATKKEARQALQDETVDRRRDQHVERSALTFGEYGRRWIEERARARLTLGRLKRTTFAIYERDLRNHLIPAIGDVQLQALTASMLTRTYAALLEKPLSAKTVGNVHGLAHRILEDAIDDGYLLRNPAARADRPRGQDTEQPTWTPEQVATFLTYVRDDDADWHAFFATIAATGIRRGEALGATWADVDLERRRFQVRQTITKAGSEVIIDGPKSERSRRSLPLPAPLVALLREHRTRQTERRLALGPQWQDADLVFPNEVGRYRYPDYVSSKFSTYARRCGLPHIGGPHGLRHSFASALDANGKGLATISALLGHASTAVTSKVYTHMLVGADLEAIDEHAAALFPEAL